MKNSSSTHTLLEAFIKQLDAYIEEEKEAAVAWALSQDMYQQAVGKVFAFRRAKEDMEDLIKKHFPEYFE